MKLNIQDAAAAVSMRNKFLEDAADFAKVGNFEKANEVLTQAGYLRNRL